MEKVDDSVYKIMYNLGQSMIDDDASDLFRTVYRHRPNHKYHGKLSPHHDSFAHHWMLGSLLVLIAQFGALANTALEAAEIAKEMNDEENQDIEYK